MEVTTAEAPAPAEQVLMLHERCDRCGHRAYVRVELHGLPLSFCGHHYNELEPGLVAAGALTTIDDRKEMA